MTKSEYYKLQHDYCLAEYNSSGSISWYETIYKCAAALPSGSDEQWVREARWSLNECVWDACSYWKSLDASEQDWVHKISDLVGYGPNHIESNLEIWRNIRNGWKDTIWDPVKGKQILDDLFRNKELSASLSGSDWYLKK